MLVLNRLRNWATSAGLELLGWILVPLGIVMMPAPGPGTLVLLGGIALLARRYTWARHTLDWLETRAIEAAKFGVATWPRIAFSALGCAWLFVLGAIWWVGPNIPEFTVARFTIPGALVATGFWLGVALLSVLAVILIRGLIRSRDPIRITIVVVVWVAGLWFATTRTPELDEWPVNIAFGPELPAAGWGTALGIWSGGVLAVGLLIFSVLRWKPKQRVA